uniref:Ig-like domain-containing protein n=1 Tax=Lates calcarifer TaxID=8187 RepID=A0A4W6DTZ5_LATCA
MSCWCFSVIVITFALLFVPLLSLPGEGEGGGAVHNTLLPNHSMNFLRHATVEWTISDPKPKVVHWFENGHHQPGQQHESYRRRTEMANPLQTGDLSLTLNDPCCDDSGIYICTVRRGQDILAQKVIEVQVQGQYCTKIRGQCSSLLLLHISVIGCAVLCILDPWDISCFLVTVGICHLFIHSSYTHCM